MKKRLKRVLILAALLTLVVAIGYVILVYLNRPVIYATLSERAKEYIGKQKLKDGAKWGSVEEREENIEGPVLRTDNSITTECYSFVLPFNLLRIKDNDPCNKYITFTTPRGFITVYQSEAPTGSLEDNPSIIMRRANTMKYKESIINVNDRTYYIYIDKSEGHNETAISQDGNTLFVLNLMGYVNEDLHPEFIKVLKSITFKD